MAKWHSNFDRRLAVREKPLVLLWVRMKWSEVKCYIQPVWKRDTGFPSLGQVYLSLLGENVPGNSRWEREISANCCSKRLRIFVYAILNDAETKAEERNIKVIQEWDREGLSVQQSIVKPYQEPNPVLRSRRAWKVFVVCTRFGHHRG